MAHVAMPSDQIRLMDTMSHSVTAIVRASQNRRRRRSAAAATTGSACTSALPRMRSRAVQLFGVLHLLAQLRFGEALHRRNGAADHLLALAVQSLAIVLHDPVARARRREISSPVRGSIGFGALQRPAPRSAAAATAAVAGAAGYGSARPRAALRRRSPRRSADAGARAQKTNSFLNDMNLITS